MRNKCTPKRGGNTGRNASNRSTPKKDSEPDKSKGLSNHVFSSGRSEDFQKICECLMSCMRPHYDNGDDIATAMEDGKPCDFSKEMPTMKTPTPPTEEEAKEDPKKHRSFCLLHMDRIQCDGTVFDHIAVNHVLEILHGRATSCLACISCYLGSLNISR